MPDGKVRLLDGGGACPPEDSCGLAAKGNMAYYSAMSVCVQGPTDIRSHNNHSHACTYYCRRIECSQSKTLKDKKALKASNYMGFTPKRKGVFDPKEFDITLASAPWLAMLR